ncbi:DUF4136 domain-containing protein [Zhouia spongiae]|uniref:DUF4136 domain-containing protein n=1 Tax=Zhouia spongiae TaxID=2202721 RepID=A0ABY3YP66_9FLAO|nr:DUF4136 domain-containing protein [Zhouia spongiae]UNY99616.1 DUF4136 domain-containing protein [Zhouia spongiae]
MKHLTTHIFFILCISLLVSCAPVKVESTRLDRFRFTQKYRSFNFYDIKVQNADSGFVKNHSKLNMLKSAIEHEMNTLGFLKSENPDLLVNLAINIEEKIQTRETGIRDAPPYMGQRSYHWEVEEVPVGKYKEGTMVIDLIDRKTNTMIGQAVASGVIVKNDDHLKKRVDECIHVIFNQMIRPKK